VRDYLAWRLAFGVAPRGQYRTKAASGTVAPLCASARAASIAFALAPKVGGELKGPLTAATISAEDHKSLSKLIPRSTTGGAETDCTGFSTNSAPCAD